MDPLTHSLTGCSIALGLNPDVPQWAMITTVLLSANAPDIDFISRAFGADTYFANHHGITHSLLVTIALGAAAAVVVGSFAGSGAIMKLLPLAIVCAISHLLLDWITPWGAAFFWPLSSRRLDVAIIGFYDILLTALILIGIILAWKYPSYHGIIILIFWGIIATYLIARTFEMRKATNLLRQQLGSEFQMESKLQVFAPPLGISFFNWCVVCRQEEELVTYYIDTWNKKATLVRRSWIPSQEDWKSVEDSIAVQTLCRQYDLIAIKNKPANGGQTCLWFSAATLPDANYRLKVQTDFNREGELVSDKLLVDIRGPYRKLIDALWFK